MARQIDSSNEMPLLVPSRVGESGCCAGVDTLWLLPYRDGSHQADVASSRQLTSKRKVYAFVIANKVL